jgi:hypothetical protein
MKHPYFLFLLLLLPGLSFSQAPEGGGKIAGSLQMNGNFFIRDSLIGAANTPQYDRQLYGGEAWLNLTYSNWGFDFGLRFDMFNNSNLLNPTGSFSGEGIGRWFIVKKINKLGIYGGYIYDQIGSGIIFRAFEERPLLIDNALYGLRLTYDILPNWQLKAFTGRQKQQFDIYNSVIRGMSLDGFISSRDSTRSFSMAPGIGAIGRTLDDESMSSLVAALNTYPVDDAFIPKYNAFAFSAYNTLTAGPISWFVEGAYKTPDAMNDPFGVIIRSGQEIVGDKFIKSSGTVLYSSLSYASGGLGVTVEGKRTENFSFRTRPQEQINRGLVNFLPPMTRVNTYRLNARYNAATQELGELAFQIDARYAPSRKLAFGFNASNITDLNDVLLYREFHLDVTYKKDRLWTLTGGIQHQNYNQERFEFKPGVPNVQTLTPFVDFLYKFDRKTSIRAEAQYMHTGMDESAGYRQDYGNWIFGLVELNVAPNWSFVVSDMYNADPGKNSPVDENGEKLRLHYPRFDVFYTLRSNRFSLSYIKQVEGVVCTGGICRLEPAFSGVRVSVSSTF